ncbi:hypothetical protein [Chromobacterium sp. IIBBL 290-4]|uniref:hypothetical protein n=1 Tax=Chromobacterium sp. IIBBL 290-4 TaxID=2953890 RepID=UPI0020B65211|nr:hypothetical protein [Chromobacterium sp. IIBBL 290-4]UTH76110.1 hypothetical protein NKT35_08410 [Chromobacterium sp. IIBBL 290-4]
MPFTAFPSLSPISTLSPADDDAGVSRKPAAMPASSETARARPQLHAVASVRAVLRVSMQVG